MNQGHPFYNPQNPNSQQQIFTPFQNNPNVPTHNGAPPTNGPPTGFQNTYPQNTSKIFINSVSSVKRVHCYDFIICCDFAI